MYRNNQIIRMKMVRNILFEVFPITSYTFYPSVRQSNHCHIFSYKVKRCSASWRPIDTNKWQSKAFELVALPIECLQPIPNGWLKEKRTVRVNPEIRLQRLMFRLNCSGSTKHRMCSFCKSDSVSQQMLMVRLDILMKFYAQNFPVRASFCRAKNNFCLRTLFIQSKSALFVFWKQHFSFPIVIVTTATYLCQMFYTKKKKTLLQRYMSPIRDVRAIHGQFRSHVYILSIAVIFSSFLHLCVLGRCNLR